MADVMSRREMIMYFIRVDVLEIFKIWVCCLRSGDEVGRFKSLNFVCSA